MSKPKILIYDLETSPYVSYTWARYETNVIKFIKHRELLSVAWKFLGDKDVKVVTKEGHKDDKKLTILLRDLFQEADIIVAHNGNKFDSKVAKTRMIAHGLKPVKHLAMIDTRTVASKYFDFSGNSLNDLCAFFSIGNKLPNQGFSLWEGCMRDDPKAWDIMARYNKHDVVLLEKLYERLAPWAENHPNIGRLLNPDVVGGCPSCGSNNLSKYGLRPTASTVNQRWICKQCGKNFLTPYKRERA